MRIDRALAPLVATFASLRPFSERVLLSALIALAFVLLVLAKADVEIVRLISRNISDVVVPVVAVLKQPITGTRHVAEEMGRLLALHAENERLREENARLRRWQNETVRLTVQNRSLRDMLEMPTNETEADWSTARIVGDSASPFVHTRLIDAGTDRDLAVGMAVMTPEGMVGRLIAVARRSSRVMLITDFNSRIPVVVARSGDHALLEGDNTQTPKLRFLPLDPLFAVGDRVLTSGTGGILPPGLPIGEIKRIDERGIAVEPFVDWDELDFVSIIRFEPLPAPDELKAPEKLEADEPEPANVSAQRTG